jgi:hypothetical protein
VPGPCGAVSDASAPTCSVTLRSARAAPSSTNVRASRPAAPVGCTTEMSLKPRVLWILKWDCRKGAGRGKGGVSVGKAGQPSGCCGGAAATSAVQEGTRAGRHVDNPRAAGCAACCPPACAAGGAALATAAVGRALPRGRVSPNAHTHTQAHAYKHTNMCTHAAAALGCCAPGCRGRRARPPGAGSRRTPGCAASCRQR